MKIISCLSALALAAALTLSACNRNDGSAHTTSDGDRNPQTSGDKPGLDTTSSSETSGSSQGTQDGTGMPANGRTQAQ